MSGRNGYAMAWAAGEADAAKLDPMASWVFVRIAGHAHLNTGRANPGADLLAAECRLSARRVRDVFGRIRAAGIVECDQAAGRAAVWWFPPVPRTLRQGYPGRSVTPHPGRSGPEPRTLATQTPDVASPVRSSKKWEEAVAARREPTTWTATLPEPEPYVKCPECGGVGFVVVGGRRSVCRNMAAHRG